jgi:hypothetical protein
MMDMNRNQFFMLGLLVLFLGIEFRMIDSFVLNEKCSRFLLDRAAANDSSYRMAQLLPAMGPTPRKVIRPPDWLGWAAISAGAVLVLHSLAMKKPEGTA